LASEHSCLQLSRIENTLAVTMDTENEDVSNRTVHTQICTMNKMININTHPNK